MLFNSNTQQKTFWMSPQFLKEIKKLEKQNLLLELLPIAIRLHIFDQRITKLAAF